MQLTQLGLTFVYSLFIEFTSYGLFFIEPHGLAAKILLSVIACAVLSIGVGFTISSGFAVMPMEGLVKTISDKKNISFGAVRVCLEVLFTVCSALKSTVFPAGSTSPSNRNGFRRCGHRSNAGTHANKTHCAAGYPFDKFCLPRIPG